MASSSGRWAPELGEIVWLTKHESKYNGDTKLPIWAPGHLALVLHLTFGEKSESRHAWLLPVSSTNSFSPKDPPYVHFQYGYRPRVKDHEPSECSGDCRKFLYLRSDKDQVPAMKKAGYFDTRTVYEVPLSCLHSQRDGSGRAWRLRECSFSLISDMANDAIASLVTRWKPHDETEILWQKLDQKHLRTNFMCWVEPASKKLTDVNGTSYTGSGPCMIRWRDSETIIVYVVLDHGVGSKDTRGFFSLEHDNEKVSLPVLIPEICTSDPPDCVRYSWPEGNSRTTYAANHHIVVRPDFQVSAAELYELPPCFLPPGTLLLQVRDSSSNFRQSLSLCVAKRESRDKEKNRLRAELEEIETLRLENELDKANELERKRQELLLQRAEEAAQKKHRELLRNTEAGLEKVKTKISDLPNTKSSVLSLLRSTTCYSTRVELHGWLETQLLLLAALARLKEEQPVVCAEDCLRKSITQWKREKLQNAIDNIVRRLDVGLPNGADRSGLRSALEIREDQCDPLSRLMKFAPEPKWQDYATKQEVEEKTTSDDSSDISDGSWKTPTEKASDDGIEATAPSDTTEPSFTNLTLAWQLQSSPALVARFLLSHLIRLATLGENIAPVVDETVD